MNTQPTEKRSVVSTLDVHSIFYTIQGEGPFAGFPAVFVRLAGCNLQCPLCDTDYTSTREKIDKAELLSRIRAASPSCHLVVITGGEPFRQFLTPAVRYLLDNDYSVQIETNGTLFLHDFPQGVTIVCSPKAGAINRQLAPRITALKYVLRHSDVAPDGLPTLALEHPASPQVARPPVGFTGPIYVQPADEQDAEVNAKNLQAAVDSAMKHGFILGLQVHKIIGKD